MTVDGRPSQGIDLSGMTVDYNRYQLHIYIFTYTECS
jgi:hypothetical protein